MPLLASATVAQSRIRSVVSRVGVLTRAKPETPAFHRATQKETNMQTSVMRSVSAVALTMVLAAGASAAPLDPAVVCGFAKMHAALKASSALNACFRHAIQTGSDPDPACVDAAHATLRTTFAKVEAKGGCSATGDASSVEPLVDRFSEELAQELNPTCLPEGAPCGNITPCCAGLVCTVTLGQTPVCG